MKIAIYGHGVTGTATGAVFEAVGAQVVYTDPPKGEYNDVQPLGSEPDAIFICVPTPAGELKFVREALTRAISRIGRRPAPSIPVVIRSTLPAGALDDLQIMIKGHDGQDLIKLVIMPEFLREMTAVEDALKRDKAVYATRHDDAAERLSMILQQAGYTTAKRVSVEACEMLKTALNSMLAIKVAFANILYDVAKANNANYDELVDLMLLDGWLSRFGLQVPGRHGRGYSGTCLPKDMDWLIESLLRVNMEEEADLLQTVQQYNMRLLGLDAPKATVIKESVA